MSLTAASTVELSIKVRIEHTFDTYSEKQREWEEEQTAHSAIINQVKKKVHTLQRLRQCQRQNTGRRQRDQADQEDFRRRKEQRRRRDQEEHFLGLKKFNGSQRGWDGQRETEKQGYVEDTGIPETEPTLTPVKRKRGRPRKATTQDSSPIPKPPSVTAEQLRQDIDNFRTGRALDVIAIEEAAIEAERKQREYSATIKWDWDTIASGGLRDDSFQRRR